MRVAAVVFEPVFGTARREVERGFTPLPTDNARPEWRELQLLIALYRRGEHRRHVRSGLFSPKFSLKTRMSGLEFLAFAEADPVADVVFINPFPQISYWSYNVWMQGEYAHRGIVSVAQALLDAAGVELDVSTANRNSMQTLCYGNFWLGTERFWDRYVGGVLDPIARFLEAHPEHPVASGVMSSTRHTDTAPYLPFVIERLFSTFLAQERDIVTRPFIGDAQWVADSCVSEFERLLLKRMRSEVDEADELAVFPQALAGKMDLTCALWQQHFFDYFAVHPHPHTGRTME